MARKIGTKNKVRKLHALDGIPKGKKSKLKNPTSFKVGNEEWMKANGFGQGREKVFETPQRLWDAFVDYAEWSKNNPLVNPGNYKDKRMRVLTLMGFCVYVGVATSYLREFKSANRKDKTAYMAVIHKIEEAVNHQAFGGASSGFFNANIISRHLGLVDKTDVTSKDMPIKAPIINIVKGNSPKLSSDEKEVE